LSNVDEIILLTTDFDTIPASLSSLPQHMSFGRLLSFK
jgi:hypothetical protein